MELDSWTSSNYKDASPTGLKNQRIKFATTTNEKISLKKQKSNQRPNRKRRLSLHDLAKDFCGSVSGPSDLSTRPLTGYGRD
jgi:hypothetical protein